MKIPAIILALLFIIYMPAYAQDNSKKVDHSKHVGEKIHESMAQGHHLAYHLLGQKNKEATHHLMVYIMDSEGKEIEGAEVGFLVKGPDGTTQKLMAMGMKGAYGVDIRLGAIGVYIIKMKAVSGDKKFIDSFHYKFE